MNKRKTFFISIVSLVSIVIIVATHIISITYYKYYGQYREGVKRVYKVPDGYISIASLENYTNGNLRYKYYPTNIGFIDSDNIGIYSMNLNDSWFIVRYKDVYYIDKYMYDNLIYDANIIAEQRNRIYNLGDAVILRSAEVVPFVIIINSIETESAGNYTLNKIKFTTNPSIPEYQSKTGRKRSTIFDHIETDKGTIVSDFTYIDEGTVEVVLPVSEKINMIILKSPDYDGCIRKVGINE